MTWLDSHATSEALAAAADEALRAGQNDLAIERFREAAELEEEALRSLDRTKIKTLGVTAVSAVALYFKSKEFQRAERLAFEVMTWPDTPPFAGQRLRELLNATWAEQTRADADVRFLPGQVLVAVRGGEVVTGGAPLDLIVEKVQTIQAMFVRTAEMLLARPLRKHGPAPADVRDLCRPWLFQAAPGSYQFAVAIQGPEQMDMFGENVPRAEEISREFMSILKAASVDPATELPKVVTDPGYRATFLKLARNLAPSQNGNVFDELEIRFPGDTHGVELSSQTRQAIQAVIRNERGAAEEAGKEVFSLEGILRAVHLDRDWLEIAIGKKHVKIVAVAETYDDIVGPLVNRPVVVRATKDVKGQFTFLDIESAQ
jgi:hypothetical protein